jgi:dihydroflavonol-4-reductase
LPPVLAQIAAKGMDLIYDHLTHRPPLGTLEGVRIALHSKPLSNEKSKRELGYEPRPIEAALRDIVASAFDGRPAFGAAALNKSES